MQANFNTAMIQNYSQQQGHLVSVDCIIFGYEAGTLKLLLFNRKLDPDKGKPSLVGGWVFNNESVEDAATRVLKGITGLDNIFMEQVQVYSKPDRDPGGRVISIAFYALINLCAQNYTLVEQYGAYWVPVQQMPNLIFDHNIMVTNALDKLRQKASYHLVGRDLLPTEFTITQLRQLYNSIYMRQFDPGNFRKKILSLKALERLDKKDTSESKKGAYYYKYINNPNYQINERIVNLIIEI